MKKISLLIGMGMLLTACMGGGNGGTTAEEQPFSGTLEAAMKLGVPMKCSYTINEVDYEGFVQGNKYVGKVEKDGQVQNIIRADNYMYTWTEGKTQGMKMSFEMDTDTQEEGEYDAGQVGMPTTNYNCVPTVVTADKFSPPANVNFLDFDEMTGGELTDEQIRALEEMGAEEE